MEDLSLQCTHAMQIQPLPSLTSGGGGGGPLLKMRLSTGIRKAAVLPEPVWAHAIRSRPSRIMGRACFCTGVGLL